MMRARKEILVPLLIIGLLALVLRVVFATRSNLWADEIFSLAVVTGHSLEHPASAAEPARGDYVDAADPRTAEELQRFLQHRDPPASMSDVVRAVRRSDTSPPLYYLLLHGWTRIFGTSDLAVRGFSIVCALACLPLVVVLARRMGGGRSVPGTLALFAFSPMVAYYSVEARMYALLWCFVLGLMILALQLQQRGAGVGRIAAWMTIATAGFYTHYFFAFPFAAAVLFLLLRPGRLARWIPLATAAAIGLLILPWYRELPALMSAWRVTSGWLELEPRDFHRWTAIRDLVIHAYSGESFYLWRLHHRWNTVALLLFAFLGVVALLRLRRRWFEGRRTLLWLWFLAACGGPLLLDALQGTYLVAVPRYAITALPAAFLLVGIALGSIGWPVRTAVVALILIAWVPSLGAIYRKTGRSGPQLREMGAYLSTAAGPEDLVLVQSIPSGVIGLARYLKPSVAMGSWVEQLGQKTLPDSLDRLIAQRRRVYFVRFHEVGAPPLAEEWLRQHTPIVDEIPFHGTRVTVFAPTDGTGALSPQ